VLLNKSIELRIVDKINKYGYCFVKDSFMIELIERKNILENKKMIASEVCKIQKAHYDEELYNCYNEKEKIEYLNHFDVIDCDILSIKNYRYYQLNKK
jgi:ribosomal protein L14E/L6E/L27E